MNKMCAQSQAAVRARNRRSITKFGTSTLELIKEEFLKKYVVIYMTSEFV